MRLEKSKAAKGKEPPITDWKQYRKRYGLDEKTKIFICSNAYKPLIAEMERRGWHRNKDRASLIFHFKNVILESESSMQANELKNWQIINHFLKNNMITTKTGLCNNLKNIKWWSSTPIDQFFPRCYNLSEGIETEDFKQDFRVCRAESILKKFVKKKEVPNVEKLMLAIQINIKRLHDIDEIIDNPSLDNLVTDEEWLFLQSDKMTDSERE